ncbi:pheromone A receptor-domain-containing protein [Armillaria luteobubalina]|uniref:Pheromone A receptor-domain-containing protein n=1 Tax=Armillaria luteobubalina TaxID=153913 RepID=A0AA39UJI9_9AGAR|nr:pheromone A receptor-domain-containing protein [Armillaria luteobubalina]
MHSDPTYPLFPVFAFFGFILPLIPLQWHLAAWNSGTCYFMIWASLASLNQFINSIVWADNVTNWAPWWCEISIRIQIGASVAVPASCMCIQRRLYQIASVRTVSVTRAEKRSAILIDSLLCVLFPLCFIALQYVVQGHRFNIYENIGCAPAIYNTLLSYFINLMWPIIIGLISASYCVLTLRAFHRRRLEFSQFLSSDRSLTVNRYFRLMALATTEICCTMPLAIAVLCLSATSAPIEPWRSWSDTHYQYSRIVQVPALLWRSNRMLVASYETTRWVTVLCPLVFFAFFGFAEEARKHYRALFNATLKKIGYQRPPLPPPKDILHQKPKPPPTFARSLSEYSPASSLATDSTSLHDIKTPPTPTSSSIAMTVDDKISTCGSSTVQQSPRLEHFNTEEKDWGEEPETTGDLESRCHTI